MNKVQVEFEKGGYVSSLKEVTALDRCERGKIFRFSINNFGY